MLFKCNFMHPKNKNNQSFLKCGNGKSMITSGMSINEFVKKHHLK